MRGSRVRLSANSCASSPTYWPISLPRPAQGRGRQQRPRLVLQKGRAVRPFRKQQRIDEDQNNCLLLPRGSGLRSLKNRCLSLLHWYQALRVHSPPREAQRKQRPRLLTHGDTAGRWLHPLCGSLLNDHEFPCKVHWRGLCLQVNGDVRRGGSCGEQNWRPPRAPCATYYRGTGACRTDHAGLVIPLLKYQPRRFVSCGAPGKGVRGW